MLNVCTIICRNYIAQARVLARSFAEHHPDGDCVVLIVDGVEADRQATESIRVVLPADLDLPDFPHMAGIYDPIELSTAVKPWLLEWMCDEYGDKGPFAYFDPDIRVFGRLTELEDLLQESWCVLTPHLNDPLPLDGLEPTEQAILLAGTYNLGFIALTATETTSVFLKWWQDRLRTGCVVDPERGFFVDQRYIDFVPGLFDGVGILRHDGYNVAYWNLATREVLPSGDGFEVNGLPLRFFHFSGFDPRKPNVLSKHQNRVSVDSSAGLRSVCAAYGEALLADGFADSASLPYGFARSYEGHHVTPEVRRVYAAASAAGFQGVLFDAEGDRAFCVLLTTLDAAGSGLPTGLVLLWESTPTLQLRFPDLRFRDKAAFLAWCAERNAAAELLGGYVAMLPHAGLAHLRKRELGVNVIGYLHAELGIGEAARSMVNLLDDAGIPVWPVSADAPASRNGAAFCVPAGGIDLPFTETLLCVNADELATLAAGAANVGLRQTRVTGLWWWETQDFPPRFLPAFDWVDRVIAGSSFVAKAIADQSRVPVSTIPLPVGVGPIAPSLPPEFPWPEGFVFYFSFDYHSVFRRKNPLGLVEAFTRAFSPQEGASLVIRSINGDRYGQEAAALAASARGRSDITLIDAYVDEPVRNALMSRCDCYVSLHRSEGFGITMAEAMYLGRPVIATAYSGNVDFMDEDNSLLVPYRLAEIGPDAEPYDPHGVWAEPDLDAAAAMMRRVFEDPSLREQLGSLGAASIRRSHSTTAAAAGLQAIFPDVIHG